MSLPILTTERIILTPVGLPDYADLQILWRDDSFTKAITGRALSAEEVWFRLLRDIGHWQALGQGNWAMRLKDTRAYVGSIGVLDYHREMIPAFDAPELGWGVGGAFQGLGLAREGLDAALHWADTALKAERTQCMISPDNTPSLKLAERVGYVPYAETSYNGHAVTLLERQSAA